MNQQVSSGMGKVVDDMEPYYPLKEGEEAHWEVSGHICPYSILNIIPSSAWSGSGENSISLCKNQQRNWLCAGKHAQIISVAVCDILQVCMCQ